MSRTCEFASGNYSYQSGLVYISVEHPEVIVRSEVCVLREWKGMSD